MLPAADPPRRIDPKIVATLRARAALAGVELILVDDDRGAPLFVASKWAMTRQMTSVDEVEVFLGRVGGPPA